MTSKFTAEFKAMRVLLLTSLLCALLTACGQKGDLYIPQSGYAGKLPVSEIKAAE